MKIILKQMNPSYLLALLAWAGTCAAQEGAKVTTPEQIDTLPGFKVELVARAERAKHGSWISVAKDPKGRLLLFGQRGQPTTRLTVRDGKVEKEEVLKLPISEVMGALFAFDSLYLNGSDGKRFGLFRLRDAGGDGQYEHVEFLREWKGGAGEHGAHGIVLGKDGKLYIVAGNFVDVPEDVLPTSPHRNYADDLALPRAEDGNGFGAGRKPPGGYVVRLDPDGKNPELFASGQRNAYDIAFNADGELFGFDSDMEWDWGTPWYRPVRVFHATSGADHGFREGTAKWPTYYFDSLPAAVDIGIGSPTGVVFGYGAKFPAKYQKALYVLDWTYGRLHAVHLDPRGASYGGTWENFVAPKTLKAPSGKTPLNLTDAIVGDDGAMYFTIGGRNTAAALYRVTYTGDEPTAPAELHDKEGAEARALRHELEQFHDRPDPKALDAAWKHLGSDDRFVRYAARIAVERQPVEQWKARALAEEEPKAALAALLALARYGGEGVQPDILKALARFPVASLPEERQLEKLRVIEVSIARQGKPTGELAQQVIKELDPLYPAKTYPMNRELAQVLLALEAPGAVARTVKLLESAPTQEEQIAYVHALRTVDEGWTPELRKAYFTWWTKDRKGAAHPPEVTKWFEDAGRPYDNGASFPRFVGNFHADAKKTLSPQEVASLEPVLSAYTPPQPRGRRQQAPPPKPRAFVKAWTMADIEPELEKVGKGRNFRRGREVYEATQCLQCHRIGATGQGAEGQGGAIGPDLSAVASRFTRRDILESTLEPSKVVSEQYMNTVVALNNGTTVVGRVLEATDDKLVIQPDPLKPDKVEVAKDRIRRQVPSTVSPMPANLVDVLTKEELLDLLAYVEAGGRRDHPAFAP